MITDENIKVIIYGDDEAFEDVTDEDIVDQSRWSTFYEKVVKHIESGRYFEVWWSRGSTEQQDFGIEEPGWAEVKPVEKTIIAYERIDS